MTSAGLGYRVPMADREHTKVPVEEERPQAAPSVPEEEGVESAEVAEGLERTPDGQLNRPDQPDADPDEAEQYRNPPVEESGGRAEADRELPDR